jgi:hypothetical protein
MWMVGAIGQVALCRRRERRAIRNPFLAEGVQRVEPTRHGAPLRNGRVAWSPSVSGCVLLSQVVMVNIWFVKIFYKNQSVDVFYRLWQAHQFATAQI